MIVARGDMGYFKNKDEQYKRSVRFEMRLTETERDQISLSAKMRNMDVSTFARRAALGRRADIRMEANMILEIRDAVKAIRDLHREMTVRGLSPPEDAMHVLIQEAIAAIKRVSK